MPGLRMTIGVLAVLGALFDQPDIELYGLEIVCASGLGPGAIYPVLQRLRDVGWIRDRREGPEPAHTTGRPPRRYYRLTMEGRARAIHALQRRDRSGLGRLRSRCAACQPFPRVRQARHERSSRWACQVRCVPPARWAPGTAVPSGRGEKWQL